MTLIQCVKNCTNTALKPVTNNLIEYNTWSQQNHKRVSYRSWHFILMLYPMINAYSILFTLLKHKQEYNTQELLDEISITSGTWFFGWIIADMLSINRNFNNLDYPTENYQRWQKKAFPIISAALMIGFIIAVTSCATKSSNISINNTNNDNHNNDNNKTNHGGNKYDYMTNDLITNTIALTGDSIFIPTLIYFLCFKFSQPKFSDGNILGNLQENLLRNAMERVRNSRRENNAEPIALISIEELESQESLGNNSGNNSDNNLAEIIEEEKIEHTEQTSNLESESDGSDNSNASEKNCPICLEPLKEKVDSSNQDDLENPEEMDQAPELALEQKTDTSDTSDTSDTELDENQNPIINTSEIGLNIDKDRELNFFNANKNEDKNHNESGNLSDNEDNASNINNTSNSQWKAIAKLPCDHLYHFPCLEQWYTRDLSNGQNCPECRNPFSIPEENLSMA